MITRFASITNARDPMLVPGAVRYGDIPGLLALLAPHKLLLTDEPAVGEAADLTIAAYEAAKASDKIAVMSAPAKQQPSAVASWVIHGNSVPGF